MKTNTDTGNRVVVTEEEEGGGGTMGKGGWMYDVEWELDF